MQSTESYWRLTLHAIALASLFKSPLSPQTPHLAEVIKLTTLADEEIYHHTVKQLVEMLESTSDYDVQYVLLMMMMIMIMVVTINDQFS